MKIIGDQLITKIDSFDMNKMEERKHQNGFRKKIDRYLRVEIVPIFEIAIGASSSPPSKF